MLSVFFNMPQASSCLPVRSDSVRIKILRFTGFEGKALSAGHDQCFCIILLAGSNNRESIHAI